MSPNLVLQFWKISGEPLIIYVGIPQKISANTDKTNRNQTIKKKKKTLSSKLDECTHKSFHDEGKEYTYVWI